MIDVKGQISSGSRVPAQGRGLPFQRAGLNILKKPTQVTPLMMSWKFFLAIMVEASAHELVSVLAEPGVKLGHSTTYRADLISRRVKRIHWKQRPVDNQNGSAATMAA